jgi:hypothetical protein
VRNERERKQAIAAKARWLVTQHVEHGRSIRPDDLRGFGKDGCAYFSRQLRAATNRQLHEAAAIEPAPSGKTAAVERNSPLLVETAEWNSLQYRRKHYAAQPRAWGLLGAIGAGIASFALAELGWTSTVSETLDGLFHYLFSIANGY